MKKTIDFIKEYEYGEISDKMYRLDPDKKFGEEGALIEIQDPSYVKYNAVGMLCSWTLEDRHEAKKVMSRKKFRKLNNRIIRRLRKYRNVK